MNIYLLPFTFYLLPFTFYRHNSSVDGAVGASNVATIIKRDTSAASARSATVSSANTARMLWAAIILAFLLILGALFQR